MKDSVSPTDAAPVPRPLEKWELAAQWRKVWRGLKWSAIGLFGVFIFIAIGQVYLFYNLFADLHPSLGGAFAGIVIGLLVWLVGLPLLNFLRSPSIAHPPDVDLDAPGVTEYDIRRRLEFDKNYLSSMAANPALVDHHNAIEIARADLLAILEVDQAERAGKLKVFERERIATLLAGLDKQVDDYIHKEALAVGSATAVSMNGSIDAFIVLWRNINMIARISRLYYGRPSLRLSLMIMRDVTVAVLLSRALDDVTDMAGDALGRVVTRLGGAIIGPLMDGSVNALMTLKLGYLAKRRCRSFDVWSEASAARATRDVFERVKRESTSLTGELVRMSGGAFSATARAAGSVAGAASGAAGKVIAAPKSAWGLIQDTFIQKPGKSTDGS